MTNLTTNEIKNVLKYTYGLIPIVAGLDKFFNLLTDWSQYISTGMTTILPMDASSFMMIVGVIEVIAGFLVLFRTQIGAYVVATWLVSIALVLLASGQFIDVAVRDLVMAVGAFTLASLTSLEKKYTKKEVIV